MNEIEAWQQGHNAGVKLAIELINEWCEMECKTITDVINAINQMKEVTHD